MTPSPLLIPFTRLAMIFLALFALALQGCSSSGGDDDDSGEDNADPSGYYHNTGFVDVKAADDMTPRLVDNVQGMVHDGQLMMLSDAENLSYVGTFTVSGNDISGSVSVYEAGVMTQDNVPLTGLITADAMITGTLSGSGAANGTFQLDYAPLADNGPVDMDMVIHTLDWDPVNNADSFLIIIADEAAPIANFGSVASGFGTFDNCRFRGRIEPVPGTHLYTLSGTMRDCVNTDTDILIPDAYSGLVSVRGIAPDDRLIVMLSNGAYGIHGEYSRQ